MNKGLRPASQPLTYTGAGEGIRTLDNQLGKLERYHCATPACFLRMSLALVTRGPEGVKDQGRGGDREGSAGVGLPVPPPGTTSLFGRNVDSPRPASHSRAYFMYAA